MRKLPNAQEWVLIMFAITACAGFLLRILSNELFAGALMAVLSFYYGAKQGEATARLAQAEAQAAANAAPPIG